MSEPIEVTLQGPSVRVKKAPEVQGTAQVRQNGYVVELVFTANGKQILVNMDAKSAESFALAILKTKNQAKDHQD